MALDDKDIFIVNREVNGVPNGWKTYKTDAQSIGEYLFTAPMPPGVIGDNGQNNFVNDGPLNVEGHDGTAIVPWKAPRETHNLHSANEYQVGTLNFLDGFWITSNGGCPHPVNVGIDMFWMSKNLPCSSDNTIVSDPDTDCIYIDYDNLTENIVCGTGGIGGGLDGSGNCLSINLCSHSGLAFSNPGECLEVLLCPDDLLMHHPSNGCLTINLKELTLALTCGGGSAVGNCAGGGLMPHPSTEDCIVVDFEYVANNIICGRNCNNGVDYGGLDVGTNGKCLIVDTKWVMEQHVCHDSIDLNSKDCLQVNQSWLEGEILKFVNCNYLEGLGCDFGDGTSTPAPGPTIDCAYIEALGCDPTEPDDNECSVLSNIWGRKLVLKESGTGQRPAIAWGTKDTSGIYMGVGGSTKMRRCRLVSDTGWDATADCGGEATTGKAEVFAAQLGDTGYLQNNFEKWTDRYFKPRSTNKSSGGIVAKFKGAGSTDNGEPGMHGIELVYDLPRRIDNSEILSVSDDTRFASFDAEAVLDAILSSDSDNLFSNGLLNWGRANAAEMETARSDYFNNIEPFIDLNQLAALHPLLVKYNYTADSYDFYTDPDDESPQQTIKPDPADRSLEPVEINENILIFLLMARARKQRARIVELETQMTDVLARLDAAGI